MTMPHSNITVTDVAIIGAGPVGLFAIFELGMLKMRCAVIDALPAAGGQCTALYPEKPIYDIPGFPSVDAVDLIRHLEAQAAPFSPEYFLGQQVLQCNKLPSGEWELVTSTGTTIHCKAVIIAAGCGAFGPNRPPLAGIEKYEGNSVHYMVARREDFRDRHIVIAGGGDSAVDWANSLADVAEKTYVVHRRDKFRAMPDSVARMQALVAEGRVEMVIPYQLEALEGTGTILQNVVVKNMDGTLRKIRADHLLAFFGLSMELGPIADWGLNLTLSHIAVEPGICATNVPGIFAIGDIATYPHKLKLILCGFAEAAQAAHAIHKIVHPDVALHFEYSTSKGVPA
jgi:thioredoxin reductase (NADPH)